MAVPKRLKRNASLSRKVSFIILRRERKTANAWKFADTIDKTRAAQQKKTTSVRKSGDPGYKAKSN